MTQRNRVSGKTLVEEGAVATQMEHANPPPWCEWPRWVVPMALGGFASNLIFSLTDHAQNGLFHWTEWIPVVSSAFAVGCSPNGRAGCSLKDVSDRRQSPARVVA